MNILDLAFVALSSALTILVFVAKTDVEKSRVRVRVKTKK
jgi:hypothetical protein